MLKQCTHCKKEKELNEENFYKSKKNKTGFSSWCKECLIEKQKAYNQTHIEEHKESNKRNYEKNKSKYNKIMSVWRVVNQAIKRTYEKEYYKNNPEKMQQYRENRKHKNHNINKQEWIECKNFFNNCCAYCGLPIEEHYKDYKGKPKLYDFHKDHVDYNGSNDLNNCVPACHSCNSKKWEFSLDEWYNSNNLIFSKFRYDRIIEWISGEYKKYLDE